MSTTYEPINRENPSRGDRRVDERYDIPIDVMLDIIKLDGSAIDRVPALIINISRTGACMISDQKVKSGSFIALHFVHEPFYTSALVVDVKQCGGAVQRIHVQFVGNEWMPQIKS